MRHLPTALFVLFSAAMWIALSLGFRPPPPTAAPATAGLSDYQNKGLELTTEMNKLVIAMASVVLAALGKLVTLEAKDGE